VGAHWCRSRSESRSPARTSAAATRSCNLDQALARDNSCLRTMNPLRVSAGGRRLSGYCPGLLHAWVRLTTGTWMGECTFTVRSGNQRAALELRQWLSASAITPQRH